MAAGFIDCGHKSLRRLMIFCNAAILAQLTEGSFGGNSNGLQPSKEEFCCLEMELAKPPRRILELKVLTLRVSHHSWS